jgi:hypothetical protein
LGPIIQKHNIIEAAEIKKKNDIGKRHYHNTDQNEAEKRKS